MAIIDVIDPPGELMYIVISRSGSMASSVSSWAMTSLALASSIWTPRKMIRSSKDGSTYLDCGWITFCSWFMGTLLGLSWCLGAHAGGDVGGAADHVVDEAVLLGLIGRVPAVPVGVLLDLLDRLPGVEGGAVEQRLLHVEHLLGLDPDVGRG